MRIINLTKILPEDYNPQHVVWFQVAVDDCELSGGYYEVIQMDGGRGWRFEMKGMYFTADIGLAIEALQLCRTLTQAIDANPSEYTKIIELASAKLAEGSTYA